VEEEKRERMQLMSLFFGWKTTVLWEWEAR
jgi:hypothetical protein